MLCGDWRPENSFGRFLYPNEALKLKPFPNKVSDVVEIIFDTAPLTVNLHEVYPIVQSGVVVDIWSVVAWGSG